MEAAIFDAEGVVIDTEPAWDRAQQVLLARRGLGYDRETVKPLLTGRDLIDGTRFLKRRYHLRETTNELMEERRSLVAHFFATDVTFITGFMDFFSLVSLSYKTALATAMEPRLFDLVDEKLKLRRLFNGQVVTLYDVGHVSKPSPDLFLYAARKLGVAARQCVVIEDAPLGLEAAHRAGMKAIGLATTYPRSALKQADLVVNGFSELVLPFTPRSFETTTADGKPSSRED